MSITSDINDPDLHITKDSGMQKKYLVLPQDVLNEGFVRPLRNSYIHIPCGAVTEMASSIAETYARDPKFYGATYCVKCKNHYPVGISGEFVWTEDPSVKVGE